MAQLCVPQHFRNVRTQSELTKKKYSMYEVEEKQQIHLRRLIHPHFTTFLVLLVLFFNLNLRCKYKIQEVIYEWDKLVS